MNKVTIRRVFCRTVLYFWVLSWIWSLLCDPSLENASHLSSRMENCTKFGQL